MNGALPLFALKIRQLLRQRNHKIFNYLRLIMTASTGGKDSQYHLLRKVGFWHPIINVNDYRMKLDLNDEFVSKWLFCQSSWEPYETQLMQRLLRPGMTFVDVGAHIGYYSLLGAYSMRRTGHVFAFEPSPRNFALLVENIRLNRCLNTVKAEQLAISDTNGERVLYLSDHNTGDHRIYQTNSIDDQLFNSGVARQHTVRVSSVTLDDYLHAHAVTEIDVIKIDVQGAEMGVLAGASRVLKASSRLVLFIEFWPHGLLSFGTQPQDVLRFLAEDIGIPLYRIDSQEKRLVQIDPEAFVAQKEIADPREQIDLIGSRDIGIMQLCS